MKQPQAGRLRPFRLSDVPIDVRLQAARRLARKDAALPDDPTDARDRLFAALAGGVSRDFAVLQRVAESPSPRVYWIPERAWKKVLG